MDDMEPISTTKAVAATASAANAVAKSSIFQALFLPTAKAYGDHWGKEAKEKLAAAADAKRQENVTAHLEAVRSKLTPNFQPDPALTDEWLDGAKNVDPIDEDLSAAWRGVLLAIGSGDMYRQKLLAVLKTLSPEEAHSFMLIAGAKSSRDVDRSLDHRRRLEELGLLSRPLDLAFDSRMQRILMMFAMSIVSAVMVGGAMPAILLASPTIYEVLRIPSSEVTTLIRSSATASSVCIAALGMMHLFLRLSKPRLSALGHALASVISRVGSAPPPSPEGDGSDGSSNGKPKRKHARKASSA